MSHLPFNSMRLAMSGQIFRITVFITLTFSTFCLFAQNVGINTLTPKAGLHVVSNDGILATGTFGQGIVQDSGAGTRLMWIPYLGAFRVGGLNGETADEFYTHRWDPDSIGIYTFAGGLNNRASGNFSFAFGSRNIASGDFSTAIGGFENFASGQYSFAAGYGNRAPSAYETVIGSYAQLYTPNDPNNFDGNDRVFAIGNGFDQNNRHNALTILKLGNIGINTDLPQDKLHIIGNVRIDAGRLPFFNTGGSVMIGEGAGNNDDFSGNQNILIGNNAGRNIVNGENNIGIGVQTLNNTGNTNSNVAIGAFSLSDALTGFENSALGTYALSTTTSGTNNAAFGTFSMQNNSTGSHNVAVGNAALFNNDAGNSNVAVGSAALYNNIGKTGNIAVGRNAGYLNNGDHNTFLGYESGTSNNGHHNVFIGSESGQNDTTSNKLIIDNSNTDSPLILGDFAKNKVFINDSLASKYIQMTSGAAAGYVLKSDASGNGAWTAPSALFSDDWSANGVSIYNQNAGNVGIGTSTPTAKLHVNGLLKVEEGRIELDNADHGTYLGHNAGFVDFVGDVNASTFIGYGAGEGNSTGGENTAVGAYALNQNINGAFNTALGNGALGANHSGYYNVSLGYNALGASVTANSNVAIGYGALADVLNGENVAVGIEAGEHNVNGIANTFLGGHAGEHSLGNDNVFIGHYAGREETGNSKLYIDNTDTTTPLIYGDFATNKVFINDSLGSKYLKMTNGASNGYIMKSDASGNASWVVSTSVFSDDWNSSGGNIYNANTINVGIGTNNPLDQLHVKGNLRVENGRIPFTGSGQSVWIGQDAGLNDDKINRNNVMIGHNAGKNNTTGTANIALGSFALDGASVTNYNIAIGQDALGAPSLTGGYNLSIGNFSLSANAAGTDNIALGQNTLGANTSGIHNISIGNYSTDANTSGSFNTVFGHEALGENVGGNNNVAFGNYAGNSSTGDNNVFIGSQSGISNTGSGNVFLGNDAGFNETGSNKLYIDNSSSGTPLIYGDFSTNEVMINDSLTVGKELGVATSTPNSTLEVNGSVAAKFNSGLTAGTTQPDGTGMVWRYSTGTGTITLPAAASCTNRMYVIINQTGTTRTISSYRDLTTTPQTTIASSVALWIMSDGTNWYQIK